MMTGNGVMHNGTTILDEYGHNLDRLKVRERAVILTGYCGGGQGDSVDAGPSQAGALPDFSLQPLLPRQGTQWAWCGGRMERSTSSSME